MPLNAKAIYPATDPEFVSFASRRSVVHSTEGIVSCTQPLAARCGLQILEQGGNAAVSPKSTCHFVAADLLQDAAVAVGMSSIFDEQQNDL